MGLCGLAAVALCPDLADLKFTRSQITERRLRCPWFTLLGPAPRLPAPHFSCRMRQLKMCWWMESPEDASRDKDGPCLQKSDTDLKTHWIFYFGFGSLSAKVISTWPTDSFPWRVYLQTCSLMDRPTEDSPVSSLQSGFYCRFTWQEPLRSPVGSILVFSQACTSKSVSPCWEWGERYWGNTQSEIQSRVSFMN